MYNELRQYRLAIDDLETALSLDPNQAQARDALAESCNNAAWEMVTGREPRRELEQALKLAHRSLGVEAWPLRDAQHARCSSVPGRPFFGVDCVSRSELESG